MEFVLAGLQCQTCLVYLDDVIVFGLEEEQDGQVKEKQSRMTVWKSNYYFAIFTTLLPYFFMVVKCCVQIEGHCCLCFQIT